ncbi:unnamed protein product [Cylindrotheca closterium]|uniref:RING-type domain-containing protein n=1 Tax=Cylindrotheca closterium TaxID=2856 RepID=A0AAD2G1R5_9STRA|nr:unnamed protein product [Cylindrotheca closterium]
MILIGNASACNPCSNNGPQEAQQKQQKQQQQQEALPEELTCSICKELVQAAVLIDKCRHSFCSFCIRLDFSAQSKKLKSKVCCPWCRAEIYPRGVNKADQHLTANLELQEQVFHFKQQQSLLSSQSRQQSQAKKEVDESSLPSPLRRSTRHSNSPPKQQPQPPSQESQVSLYSKRNPPLPKMRAVHYQGKKRKDLIALLRPYGLPCAGTEDELKNRHTRFVTYWNSCCDEQVDPPSEATVIQQFRSSEVKKASATAAGNSITLMMASSSNGNSSGSSGSGRVNSINAADDRARLLQEHAEGFRAIHEKILEDSCDQWCNASFRLAIAVLQSHPMIQNDSFRDCLRQRAMNENHQEIPIQDLLSGEVPIPTTIFENIDHERIKRNSPSVPTNMPTAKRPRIEAPATPVGAPISNPYSKKRQSNSIHQPPTATARDAKLVNHAAPMLGSTALRNYSPSLPENPYRKSCNNTPSTATKSMSTVGSPAAATASLPSRSPPRNPYRKSVNNTPSTATKSMSTVGSPDTTTTSVPSRSPPRNPYRKSVNNTPSTATKSMSTVGSPAAATTSVPSRSPPRNPYRKSCNNTPSTATKSMSTVGSPAAATPVEAAKKEASTTTFKSISVPMSEPPPHKAIKAATTSVMRPNDASHQNSNHNNNNNNNIQQNNSNASKSNSKPSPSTAISQNDASQPRNAVSPPTVATSFFTKKTTRPKSKWEWTCQVCMYEMKLDPRATKCACCGKPKGATLEDAFSEHHQNSISQTQQTQSSSAGSQNDPIEMC